MVPKHIFKLEKDKKYNFDNINELVGSSPYKVKKLIYMKNIIQKLLNYPILDRKKLI